MDSTTTDTARGSTLDQVRAALAALGHGTPAEVAAHTELAYSTTTKKLRTLQAIGHTETFGDGTERWWRLTAAGTAHHGTTPADSTPGRRPPAARPEPDQHTTGDQTPDDDASPADRVTAALTPHGPDKATAAPPTPDEAGTTADAANADAAPQGHRTAGAEPDEPHDDTPTAAPTTTGDEPAATLACPPEVAVTTDADRAPETPVGEAATNTARRSPARPRRGKGALRAEVLHLLRSRHGTALTVGEICKLINQGNDGKNVNPASAGAVVNALDVLVSSHDVARIEGKPARYEATATTRTT